MNVSTAHTTELTDRRATRRATRVATAGAALHVEIRGRGPALVLHAAPMASTAFTEVADALATDNTVVTMDPRGIARSTVDDRAATVTPDIRAADVAAVIDHLDLSDVVVFGSSGGAVSALALAAEAPGPLAAVIAHEPPVATLLPDVDQVRADTDQMIATYETGDRVGYWRQFLVSAGIEVPDPVFDEWFGTPPTGRDLEDERFGVLRMEEATTFWEPPVEQLASGRVPVVVAIGADSAGQLCDRTSQTLAERLDVDPVVFPGDHTGFVSQPDAFATVLRDVLSTVRD